MLDLFCRDPPMSYLTFETSLPFPCSLQGGGDNLGKQG